MQGIDVVERCITFSPRHTPHKKYGSKKESKKVSKEEDNEEVKEGTPIVADWVGCFFESI